MTWAVVGIASWVGWAVFTGWAAIYLGIFTFRATTTAFRTGRMLRRGGYWNYEDHPSVFYLVPLCFSLFIAILALSCWMFVLIAKSEIVAFLDPATRPNVRTFFDPNLAFLVVVGLTKLFYDWVHRAPPRDPSQISTLHKIGRLTLGLCIATPILYGIGWFIWGR